jgi:hypothetical protein
MTRLSFDVPAVISRWKQKNARRLRRVLWIALQTTDRVATSIWKERLNVTSYVLSANHDLKGPPFKRARFATRASGLRRSESAEQSRGEVARLPSIPITLCVSVAPNRAD